MIGWLNEVARCVTERELCEMTRYYLATLSPEEWATMPERCWPKVKAIDDLDYWCERLAGQLMDCAGDEQPPRVLQDLVIFFTAVCERLAQLRRAAVPPLDGDGNGEGEAAAQEDTV